MGVFFPLFGGGKNDARMALVTSVTALTTWYILSRFVGKKRRLCEASEWALREELAAAYRLAARLGWDEVIYNHITARVPGEEAFLINPFGLHFDEVTAASLVKIDVEGNVLDSGNSGRPINCAGFVIHSAVHEARRDVQCVWHTHYTPAVAVGSTKQGLLPLSQEACIILPKLSDSVHPFEGLASDPDEKKRLVHSLGQADCLFLANHGLLCCGETVPAAFWNTYLLCRACQHQVAALSLVHNNPDNNDLTVPGKDIVKATADRLQVSLHKHGQAGHWGRLEFDALKRHFLGLHTPAPSTSSSSFFFHWFPLLGARG